jgi:hypothetical protein
MTFPSEHFSILCSTLPKDDPFSPIFAAFSADPDHTFPHHPANVTRQVIPGDLEPFPQTSSIIVHSKTRSDCGDMRLDINNLKLPLNPRA